MNEFTSQFGIDWKLLLSQATSFAVLFFVLRFTAYKPLLRLLKYRREAIEQGIEKAKEADLRLGQVNEIAKERLREADQQALLLLRETEEKAKKLEAELVKKAGQKEEELLNKAEMLARGRQEEAEKNIREVAISLVKGIIAKTVEMDPKKIDEALIEKASQITKI